MEEEMGKMKQWLENREKYKEYSWSRSCYTNSEA